MPLKLCFVVFAAVAIVIFPISSQAQLVLRAGTNPAGVPASFFDSNSNTYRGVSVDLITEIGKDAGFQVQFTPIGLPELIPALTSNKIDIIVANTAITPERKALIDFSEPFLEFSDGLVIAKSDTAEYKSIEDLKGKVIGTGKSTPQLAAIQKTGLFPEIKLFDNWIAVMREVSEGRIDAGIVGDKAAIYELRQGEFPNLQLVKSYKPMFSGRVAFGLRKSDGELLRKIDAAIEKLKANGTVAKILAKYGF
jgi:polar amino acid transport system substrate-binding protein